MPVEHNSIPPYRQTQVHCIATSGFDTGQAPVIVSRTVDPVGRIIQPLSNLAYRCKDVGKPTFIWVLEWLNMEAGELTAQFTSFV